jgi:structural maintenance of chromosome 1
MGVRLDETVSKLSAEIEKMAPNMKAVEKYGPPFPLPMLHIHEFIRLEDVEAKLLETEKEASKTRQDSKTARDKFNEIKKKR